MTKILVFHHYNSSMGAGLSLLHILSALPFDASEITVCLPKIAGDLDTKIKAMKIRVRYAECIDAYMHFSGTETAFCSVRHCKNVYKILKDQQGISEIIIDEDPDVVVVNSMTLCWIGSIAKQLHKKAICFHRETYRHGWFGVRTHYIKRKISNDFDAVAFLSFFDRDQSYAGKAKYVRITDKVDVALYEKLESKERRTYLGLPSENVPLILYTGGMAKLKGPKVLVKALHQMQETEAKLVFLQYQARDNLSWKSRIKLAIKAVLGKDMQHKIERYVQKKGLSDRILFRAGTDHVEDYFVACDVVVFPCHNAHQARPLYEAGVAKKPIIITDFPNYNEFVDESSGWLFERECARDLARCLDEAVRSGYSDKAQKNYMKAIKDNNLNSLSKELRELFCLVGEMK